MFSEASVHRTPGLIRPPQRLYTAIITIRTAVIIAPENTVFGVFRAENTSIVLHGYAYRAPGIRVTDTLATRTAPHGAGLVGPVRLSSAVRTTVAPPPLPRPGPRAAWRSEGLFMKRANTNGAAVGVG